ncbi:MAG: spermidine/putrescine ABC transporter substrate-binding protein [Legionellaceae bacterium]|nr:spermidine/putrescine ABC transporter substrate-binding protein [Legionellaceae bacterium]
MRRLRPLITTLLILTSSFVIAKPTVNVYAWGNEIPTQLIWQFEQESGINVNFSTYDSNETMYTKLRASKEPIYDVIVPSGYFVERMATQHLLTTLDVTKLPNLANLDPLFKANHYDPGSAHSVPMVWGVTGIFYNSHWISNPPTSWQMLWDPRWKNQLMMLDDAREIFSIALITLGYNANDTNPDHIQEAYQKLLLLVPNIKLFGSDAIQSVMIDEDSTLGSSWNGDVVKAHAENPRVEFIYPKEGFIIWVDCLAIPSNAPHPNEAYQFINFMLKAQSGAEITLQQGYPTTNLPGKKRLPDTMQNDPLIFPSVDVLKHGEFQRDVGEKTIDLYNEYWQKLKLAF